MMKNVLLGWALAFGAAGIVYAAQCSFCDGTGLQKQVCQNCNGIGHKNGQRCFTCKGYGYPPCFVCGGDGQVQP
jgi:DnaJ-class molecular chaperone